MRERIEEFHRKTDIAAASSMYGQMSDFVVRAESLFLEDTKPVSVLVLLTQISQDYLVKTDIRYIENVTESEYSWPYMRFEIIAEGYSQEIFNFLREIEAQEKLIVIESFDIEEKESEDVVDNIFISKMLLRFFY